MRLLDYFRAWKHDIGDLLGITPVSFSDSDTCHHQDRIVRSYHTYRKMHPHSTISYRIQCPKCKRKGHVVCARTVSSGEQRILKLKWKKEVQHD